MQVVVVVLVSQVQTASEEAVAGVLLEVVLVE
jgi:hypothetical protein